MRIDLWLLLRRVEDKHAEALGGLCLVVDLESQPVYGSVPAQLRWREPAVPADPESGPGSARRRTHPGWSRAPDTTLASGLRASAQLASGQLTEELSTL